MTFVDVTSSQASDVGNWSRFVNAQDHVASGQRGVDFYNAFNVNGAWRFTTSCSASFNSGREEPAA